MSTPKTLVLPPGVENDVVETARGPFAVQRARAAGSPVGHVVLIPGWTGSKEDFTTVLPLLAKAGFDATGYDQRGQFETAGTDAGDYSIDGFAADALALRSAVSDAPAHVLGHSFGGLVAQRAVIADPGAWRSLSLLCTGPGALGESPTRPLGRLVRALDDGVPMLDIHRAREAAMSVEYPPAIEEFKARRFARNGRASLRAITQHLIDAPDRLGDVVATGVPVWVGRGARDDAWPHDVQARMAERAGTTIHVIAHAAHSPNVENPEGLLDAWLPFLLKA